MSALAPTADVVIVGAGPTGLALAGVLARERVSFVLVDRLAEVVRFTDRMTRMATLRARRARTLRNAVIGIVGRLPAFRRWLATELSELRYR